MNPLSGIFVLFHDDVYDRYQRLPRTFTWPETVMVDEHSYNPDDGVSTLKLRINGVFWKILALRHKIRDATIELTWTLEYDVQAERSTRFRVQDTRLSLKVPARSRTSASSSVSSAVSCGVSPKFHSANSRPTCVRS